MRNKDVNFMILDTFNWPTRMIIADLRRITDFYGLGRDDFSVTDVEPCDHGFTVHIFLGVFGKHVRLSYEV
jgi:hypothetical protein